MRNKVKSNNKEKELLNGLKEKLLLEEKYLKQIITKTQTQLQLQEINEVTGKLRISVNEEAYRYYVVHSSTEGSIETYLSRMSAENMKQARLLAQKTYLEKVSRLAEKRLKQIEKLLKGYENDEIQKIYDSMHAERKKLVEPIELSWEDKKDQWIKQEYRGKEFKEGTTVILTEKGEQVRSKSEKILADYFYHHGICYKYEKPLRLRGVGIVYPDFTFLSPTTGGEIYWEHDGRMDDPIYARSAIKKLKAYEENGIYIGEKLIATFETSESIISTKIIENKVEKYLR